MPIEVACPACHKKIRAPDAAAGKRVKCPGCQLPFKVPGGETITPAAAGNEQWLMLTGDFEQFGPVTREELDSWVEQGRIDAQCQLKRQDGKSWEFATDIYPILKIAAAPSAPVSLAPVPLPEPLPASVAFPASSIKRPARRSELVSAVGYVSYGLIATEILRIVIVWLMAMSGMEAASPSVHRVRVNGQVHETRRDNRDTAMLVATVVICVHLGIVAVVLIPYGISGWAVLARRRWGRIMCFVMAGFSCFFLVCSLIWLPLDVLHVGMAATSPFSKGLLPSAIVALVLDVVLEGLLIAHPILCFGFLTKEKYAAEFH